MEIKGLIKTSLIDYPGRISSVVFFGGCNFRCGFCFNPSLVLHPDSLPSVPEEEVFSYLRKRKKWIDGVVLLGGEPTLQPGIQDFAEKLKKMGFLVKLDTNGSNPKIVKEMIESGLVDYVAMDVKSSPEGYERLGLGRFADRVFETAGILMKSGVEYEFRTTAVPGVVDEEDVTRIGERLRGGKRYFIQQFRPENTLSPEFSREPYPKERLERMVELARPFFGFVGLRA